jgi:hypothetical protein
MTQATHADRTCHHHDGEVPAHPLGHSHADPLANPDANPGAHPNAGTATSIDQNATLLAYMIDHNLEHKTELEECRDSLAEQGATAAADLLTQGIDSIDTAIERMRSALELIRRK